MNLLLVRWSSAALLLASGVVSGWGAEEPTAAVRQDRSLIEGTWRIVELDVNGNRGSAEDARKLTVVNGADGSWVLFQDGHEIVRGTSTIDPTKMPKTIDFTPKTGDDQGRLFLGIYELGKTRRRLCFAPAGKDRPEKFQSLTGSEHLLVTFEREPSQK